MANIARKRNMPNMLNDPKKCCESAVMPRTADNHQISRTEANQSQTAANKHIISKQQMLTKNNYFLTKRRWSSIHVRKNTVRNKNTPQDQLKKK